MFNLLPDSLKEKIKTEYRLRLITSILLFVIFLQTLFIILLFPTWLFSFYKEGEVTLLVLRTTEFAVSSSSASVRSVVNGTNTKLNIINNSLEYVKFTPLLNAIISKKINGIHINRASYISQSSSQSTVLISGLSQSREALVSFVKSLKDSGLFQSVDMPIGNLAKNHNLEFSISLSTPEKS